MSGSINAESGFLSPKRPAEKIRQAISIKEMTLFTTKALCTFRNTMVGVDW